MRRQEFKDHFSGHAAEYARYRPSYPEELFEHLATLAPNHALAWDVGTGNGQVASGLARYFQHVHATDASAPQIAAAPALPGVSYRVEPAEECSLDDGTVQLVAVGQALHWFDQETFHAEVHRVLSPGGIFAAFTYELCRVSPGVDAVVDRLYAEIVGPWWPPERVHVERGYQDLPFPYRELERPHVDLVTSWALKDYLNYLGTWSSVQRYRAERKADPVSMIKDDLCSAWGEKSERKVSWPLAIRVGRKHG